MKIIVCFAFNLMIGVELPQEAIRKISHQLPQSSVRTA